jgi:transcriptional regulator with XRE-family HTH domain
MLIGDRLKALRESKNLSQGEIEQRSGLLRCYISRVENGHTVPAIETLEKMARALASRCTAFSTRKTTRSGHHDGSQAGNKTGATHAALAAT